MARTTGGVRTRRARPAPEPAAAEPETASEAQGKPKQAVVIIHGMGEQVPLETIGEFVDTVYSRDPAFAAEGKEGELNPVSMVPDKATGSAELRRVTTHPGKDGKRTDFYELYWADIMEDNPLDIVTSWVAALLLRSPFRLPLRPQIIIVWLLLWVMALVVVTSALIVMFPQLAETPWVEAVGKWMWPWFSTWHATIGGFAMVAGALVLVFRLVTAGDLARARWWLPMVLVAVGAFLVWFPPEILAQKRVWASLVTGAVGWLFTTFVRPYFGDVVRYVRATPRTVERRLLVRERGLRLLRALHLKKSSNGTAEYDRIVIVGHSLGTVIAYDLLLHYWQQHGPDHDHAKAITPEVAKALREVDRFVGETWPKDSGFEGSRAGFDLAAYRKAQEALYAALRESPLKWRISDLITLGSPLVHAEFLVVDTRDDLRQAFEERRFAASPPRPDPTQGFDPPTMLYDNDKGEGPFAHFAAPFATVRWVNIHDSVWFPAFGDVVSGPVQPTFGPGVWEYDVQIRRPRWLPLADRIFTHTRYWAWYRRYRPDNPPVHIGLLRDALNLDGTRELPLPTDRKLSGEIPGEDRAPARQEERTA